MDCFQRDGRLVPAATTGSSAGLRGRRTALVGACIVALGVAGVFTWRSWSRQGALPVRSETRLEVSTPATTQPWSIPISPDGLTIAFVAESEGRPVLWVCPSNEVTARPLRETSGAPFVLVPGQPVDRVFRGRKAEANRPQRRCAANRGRRTATPRRRLESGRHHRLCSPPTQSPSSGLGGWWPSVGSDAAGIGTRRSHVPARAAGRRPSPVLRGGAHGCTRCVSGPARWDAREETARPQPACRICVHRTLALPPGQRAVCPGARRGAVGVEWQCHSRRRPHRDGECWWCLGRGRHIGVEHRGHPLPRCWDRERAPAHLVRQVRHASRAGRCADRSRGGGMSLSRDGQRAVVGRRVDKNVDLGSGISGATVR